MTTDFLADHDYALSWSAPEKVPAGLGPESVYIGSGEHGLEVALAHSQSRPRVDDVRKLWKQRHGGRPSPVLLVVDYPDHGTGRASICGPVGDNPPVVSGLELAQVERLCAAALLEPTRHVAVRFLVAMLDGLHAELIPGLRNMGMLATYELRIGVPQRPDWDQACRTSKKVLPKRGRQLVEALGFGVETLSTNSSVLTIVGAKRVVAVFLDEGESFENPATRFSGGSPVAHSLALAERENLPWVVLTRGHQIRLYSARAGTGVGHRGPEQTFVELNLALLPEEAAGYLPLLFGPAALTEGGTFEQILEASGDHAAELGKRLRERVYFRAVPTLARAVAARMGEPSKLEENDLQQAYEQTLVILFRLLFVAYAEDKDLLPYRTNGRYQRYALKTLAKDLAEQRPSAGDIASTPVRQTCGSRCARCGGRWTRAIATGACLPTMEVCSAITLRLTGPVAPWQASRSRTRRSGPPCTRCWLTKAMTSSTGRSTSAACRCGSSAPSTKASSRAVCRWRRRI